MDPGDRIVIDRQITSSGNCYYWKQIRTAIDRGDTPNSFLKRHFGKCDICRSNYDRVKKERSFIKKMVPHIVPSGESLETMRSEIFDIVDRVYLERYRREHSKRWRFVFAFSSLVKETGQALMASKAFGLSAMLISAVILFYSLKH